MIQARINEKSGKVVSIEMSGHAMSGEYGHDIVCSAVSVLSITTINNIERMVLGFEPPVEVESGYLYVTIPQDLSEKEDEKTQFLLTAFTHAMKEVEQEYGKYLKVTITK
jgi:uncharacterized protein YsxB (DUF464 family)